MTDRPTWLRAPAPGRGPAGPRSDTDEPAPVSGAARVRILLVEDDDADAILVEENLRDAGLDADVRRARTLDEAVGRLDVDCVLLDLGLPDALGLGALRRMLAAGSPAIVVLTGLAGGDIGLQALAQGAQDYLVKGEVDAATLGRAVRYAVVRRQLEDTNRALYRSLVRAADSHRLERALLPTPRVRDARLDVQVGYRAGRDGLLGGDFFDVVEVPDGRVLALVGDVCGHGPDEAALGATLRTAWRTLVLVGTPVAEIFPLLERVLDAERARPEVFTTASMLVVSADRTSADLYLAGHPGPLLLGPPSVPLPTTTRGRALGVPASGGWLPVRLELGPRWRVMLYTDGILEATVLGTRARIGSEGLIELVDEALTAAGPVAVVDVLLDHVRTVHGGELVDDTAVVALGWGA